MTVSAAKKNDGAASHSGRPPFKVADLSLAEFGRKEIRLAEQEMPGLMALRKRYAGKRPLAGAKIMGSLHMTIQTAVLIETLVDLGADVRWVSCNIFSTQDHAAAAVVVGPAGRRRPSRRARPSSPGRARRSTSTGGAPARPSCGRTAAARTSSSMTAATRRCWCTRASSSRRPARSRRSTRRRIRRSGASSSTWLRAELKRDPKRWTRVASRLRGVSEETTTGVHRLYQMMEAGTLLFPAINVNDSVTKSKFDNIYGCRHSLVDGICRASDVMLGGKVAVVCGFGEVGKGCAQALRGQGCRVVVTEIDPICALQAAMEGYEVNTLDDMVERADLFITATGNLNIITTEHMKRMKDKAIVGNIGHFDNEIDMAGLKKVRGIERINIKPQYDEWRFPDGHSVMILAEGRLLNLGCATGHPSFVMSASFSNQVIAQLELHTNNAKYEKKVYMLPKHLDEEVARLHLDHLGVKLTKLTKEQADYIGVPASGPYKSDHYRY